jgi:hypothetical protein
MLSPISVMLAFLIKGRCGASSVQVGMVSNCLAGQLELQLQLFLID